jgi:hypothetical protein
MGLVISNGYLDEEQTSKREGAATKIQNRTSRSRIFRYIHQLPKAKSIQLSAALAAKIRDRRDGTKSPISIRLEPEQIDAEGIRREGKRA